MNSMEYSIADPRTFALKLKVDCKECERKLKKLLQSIQGVHSVTIIKKQHILSITGTIDPSTIITMLEKYGRKAELLWDQRPAKHGEVIQISTANDYYPKKEESLQKILSETTKKLKNVEVAITDKVSSPDQQLHGEIPCCVASASCCGGHGIHTIQDHHGCCYYHPPPAPPPTPPMTSYTYNYGISDDHDYGCMII